MNRLAEFETRSGYRIFINPDNISAVEAVNDNITQIYLCGGDNEKSIFINMPINDVLVKRTAIGATVYKTPKSKPTIDIDDDTRPG